MDTRSSSSLAPARYPGECSRGSFGAANHLLDFGFIFIFRPMSILLSVFLSKMEAGRRPVR